MSISVRTKTPKKQYAKASQVPNTALPQEDHDFEQALLDLDNACLTILQNPLATGRKDIQRLYWQQRFINIVNPVSLALMEYKGPRHFHYHYRHRKHDDSILHPVLENPVDMLAQVCREALSLCRSVLVGLDDEDMMDMRFTLESALAEFNALYRKYRLAVEA